MLDADLEMLRRIDPEGGELADVDGVDLEAAWAVAAASIVEEHNSRADPRAAQDAIGPAQRFALELLRDPTVILPEGAERAADALAVERSSAVRRALNEIAAEAREERISRNDGARRVVELVDRLGLQPVRVDEVPAEISEDDLGVVCWMAVLPAGPCETARSAAGSALNVARHLNVTSATGRAPLTLRRIDQFESADVGPTEVSARGAPTTERWERRSVPRPGGSSGPAPGSGVWEPPDRKPRDP